MNHPLSKASVKLEMAVPTNDNIKQVHGRQTNISVWEFKPLEQLHSWALLATYPYTRHAATEPGLYNESNQ